MSRIWSFLFYLFLSALPAQVAWSQHYKLEYDKQSAQGLLLEEASHSQDDGERASLIDEYLRLFPKDRAAAWAYDQLRQIADRAAEPDRTIGYSEKLLELDPGD